MNDFASGKTSQTVCMAFLPAVAPTFRPLKYSAHMVAISSRSAGWSSTMAMRTFPPCCAVIARMTFRLCFQAYREREIRGAAELAFHARKARFVPYGGYRQRKRPAPYGTGLFSLRLDCLAERRITRPEPCPRPRWPRRAPCPEPQGIRSSRRTPCRCSRCRTDGRRTSCPWW